jgi:hypothetical protein
MGGIRSGQSGGDTGNNSNNSIFCCDDDCLASVLQQQIHDYETMHNCGVIVKTDRATKTKRQPGCEQHLDIQTATPEPTDLPPVKKVSGASDRLIKPLRRPTLPPLEKGTPLTFLSQKQLLERLYTQSLTKERCWAEKIGAELAKDSHQRKTVPQLQAAKQVELTNRLFYLPFAQDKARADKLSQMYHPNPEHHPMSVEQEKESVHRLYKNQVEFHQKMMDRLYRKYITDK